MADEVSCRPHVITQRHYSRTYPSNKNAHAKSIGRGCNGFDRVLKGGEGIALHLGDKSRAQILIVLSEFCL